MSTSEKDPPFSAAGGAGNNKEDDDGYEDGGGQAVSISSAGRPALIDGASGALVFASCGGHESGDAGGEAVVEIAGFESGRDLFLDDAIGDGIGDDAFETVSDFNAHFAILDEDEEDEAVVFIFLADAPGAEGLDGEIFEGGVGGEFGKDSHDDLAGGGFFEFLELGVESRGGVGPDEVGIIVEITRRFGRWCDGRLRATQSEQCDEEPAKENSHLLFEVRELDLRGIFSTGLGGEVRFGAESEHFSPDDRGEALGGGVIGLDGFIEIHASDGDSIFGAFELGLEVAETLGGAELGVAFGDNEQAGEGSAELALGFFKFLELFGRFGCLARGDLDFADGGAGLGHFGDGRFFEVGGALDRGDEVGDEIGPALIKAFDCSPFGVGILFKPDEFVVTAPDHQAADQ